MAINEIPISPGYQRKVFPVNPSRQYSEDITDGDSTSASSNQITPVQSSDSSSDGSSPYSSGDEGNRPIDTQYELFNISDSSRKLRKQFFNSIGLNSHKKPTKKGSKSPNSIINLPPSPLNVDAPPFFPSIVATDVSVKQSALPSTDIVPSPKHGLTITKSVHDIYSIIKDKAIKKLEMLNEKPTQAPAGYDLSYFKKIIQLTGNSYSENNSVAKSKRDFQKYSNEKNDYVATLYSEIIKILNELKTKFPDLAHEFKNKAPEELIKTFQLQRQKMVEDGKSKSSIKAIDDIITQLTNVLDLFNTAQELSTFIEFMKSNQHNLFDMAKRNKLPQLPNINLKKIKNNDLKSSISEYNSILKNRNQLKLKIAKIIDHSMNQDRDDYEFLAILTSKNTEGLVKRLIQQIKSETLR